MDYYPPSQVVLLGMDILSALVSRLQERFRTQVGTGEPVIIVQTKTDICRSHFYNFLPLIPLNSRVSQFCRASWTGWGTPRTKFGTRTRPSS